MEQPPWMQRRRPQQSEPDLNQVVSGVVQEFEEQKRLQQISDGVRRQVPPQYPQQRGFPQPQPGYPSQPQRYIDPQHPVPQQGYPGQNQYPQQQPVPPGYPQPQLGYVQQQQQQRQQQPDAPGPMPVPIAQPPMMPPGGPKPPVMPAAMQPKPVEPAKKKRLVLYILLGIMFLMGLVVAGGGIYYIMHFK